jgi:hypothetical protein
VLDENDWAVVSWILLTIVLHGSHPGASLIQAADRDIILTVATCLAKL